MPTKSLEKRRNYSKRWRKEHPDYYQTPERKERAKQATRKWRSENLIKARESNKIRARFKRTGCTEELYAKLFTEQMGVCKICGGHGDLTNHRTLVPDHDHNTRKIRGLLCNGCNGGLGLFNDDISKLRRAITYLEENL